ncbi:hypothetical protein FQN50_009336 [Emmonsiellopsis sp. PD_5]|nr:hypothetical protein FQN50_009336 [Emmonsiellopsis sp. PD_5]
MPTSPSPSPSPSSHTYMDEESAKSILRRAFSTIPTNPPPPHHHHHDTHSPFTCIGRGTCGTVWSLPTPPSPSPALKTSPHLTSLQTDFTLTNAVHNAFIATHHLLTTTFPTLTTPLVPKCTHFFPPSDYTWWTTIHPLFPAPDAPNPDTSAAMQMHRIPPLPAQVRMALINAYFHPEARREAFDDPENEDCLVRVYLGATTSRVGRGKNWPSSLRNFEMYLDMAMEVGLDVELIAEEMAVSLAVIHWEAGNDGMDAEWVFGGGTGRGWWYPAGVVCEAVGEEEGLDGRGYMCQQQKVPRDDDYPPTANDPKPRTMPPIYILDFDKARRIQLDDSCIPLLLGGVTANDPYFPNSKSSSVELWGCFREAYRVASEVLLRRGGFGGDEGVMGLPGRFLEAWEGWARGDEDGELGFEFVGWGEGDEEDWSDEEDEEGEVEDSTAEDEWWSDQGDALTESYKAS